jgi:hypothetical protein
LRFAMRNEIFIPSPMSAATSKKAPADKREAILDAGLALFVERGFHGTAVPELAAAAGVGAGDDLPLLPVEGGDRQTSCTAARSTG